ncbi:MAG: DUF3899 domain-containing protein [Clostridia bacterium]|nr:DUF3899 domain-containing protein [Clostridia bacterium]
MSKKAFNYLFAVAFGLVVSFLVMWLRGIFTAEDALSVIKYLCDGFFVAAVLLGGVGLLSWCSNEGAFDMLSYSMSTLWRVTFARKDGWKKESYGDYKERKHEKSREFSYFLWVALAYLILSVVLTAVYLSMSSGA